MQKTSSQRGKRQRRPKAGLDRDQGAQRQQHPHKTGRQQSIMRQGHSTGGRSEPGPNETKREEKKERNKRKKKHLDKTANQGHTNQASVNML